MHGQIRVTVSSITLTGAPLLRWRTGGVMPDGIGSWFFRVGQQSAMVVFPHRLPFVIFGILAAAPWVRDLQWRFSLRTLLIGMTVVATLLGAIVWAVK
jgi:hypothetical protein